MTVPDGALSTAPAGGVWVRGSPLRSTDFPARTPLNHFFAWNEQMRRRDRRYHIACDLHSLMTALRNGEAARRLAVTHLASHPIILARRGRRLLLRTDDQGCEAQGPAAAAARQVVHHLVASLGSCELGVHAGFFAAFEQLAEKIDLYTLARRRPQLRFFSQAAAPRRILVVRLSALGDFVQALGPAAAIRRRHRDARIALLTTSPLAGFAERLDFFDEVLIDRRPGAFDAKGWLDLRRRLRQGRFDRVYDLQTSQRSAAYARLFYPGPMPQWSGIVAGCSHPHANLDRDRQHTIDKQAEQMLMAGVHPAPLPQLPSLASALPSGLVPRRFVLLVPGSSPRHPAKRWPARQYGMLARDLRQFGYDAVVIGSKAERGLAAAIREVCPGAIDLVGLTDIETVGALAQQAVLTIGNDTGVTHLAAAAGCAIIVLFSSASNPAWCAPRGRDVRILSVPDLAQLTVGEVFAEARHILARNMPAPGGQQRRGTADGENLQGVRG